MGYDMYWVDPPTEQLEDRQVTLRREELYRQIADIDELLDIVGGSPVAREDLIARRHALRCEVAALPEQPEPHYFRLNIWGMQIARQAMFYLGMLASGLQELLPGWPDQPDEDESDKMEEEQSPAYREYERKREEVLSWHPEGSLICLHKLCSNDGWTVTPEEINNSLRVLQERDQVKPTTDEGEEIEWWDEWVAWLAEAAKHGGFKVW